MADAPIPQREGAAKADGIANELAREAYKPKAAQTEKPAAGAGSGLPKGSASAVKETTPETGQESRDRLMALSIVRLYEKPRENKKALELRRDELKVEPEREIRLRQQLLKMGKRDVAEALFSEETIKSDIRNHDNSCRQTATNVKHWYDHPDNLSEDRLSYIADGLVNDRPSQESVLSQLAGLDHKSADRFKTLLQERQASHPDGSMIELKPIPDHITAKDSSGKTQKITAIDANANGRVNSFVSPDGQLWCRQHDFPTSWYNSGNNRSYDLGNVTVRSDGMHADGLDAPMHSYLLNDGTYTLQSIQRISRVDNIQSGDWRKFKYDNLNWHPGDKLGAGDYEIKFVNGRCFQVHVPEKPSSDTPPVMVLVPGCSNQNQNPRGYITDAHLNDESDRLGFVAVTALTAQHRLGERSYQSAWGWNTRNSLMSDNVVQRQERVEGSTEVDYFDGVYKLVPQLTSATDNYKNWGVLAGSQGSMAAREWLASPRAEGKVPFVMTYGGSLEASEEELGRGASGTRLHIEPEPIPAGNATDVIVCLPLQDSILAQDPIGHTKHDMVFPLISHYDQPASNFIHGAVKPWAEYPLDKAPGMEGVNVCNQLPQKQISEYLQIPASEVDKVFRRLGDNERYRVEAFRAFHFTKDLKTDVDFDTPIRTQASLDRDIADKEPVKIVYFDKTRNVSVTELIFPTADHLIAGPINPNSESVVTSRYTGFYTARAAAQRLMERVSQKK